MVWIALMEQSGGQFDPRGLGRPHIGDVGKMAPDHFLRRGTLMIEAQFSAQPHPQTLLSFRHAAPHSGGFSLRALPRGGVVLAQNLGRSLRHATIEQRDDTRSDQVRICYSWDCDAGQARLSLEHLDNGASFTVRMADPHPMPLADLQMASMAPSLREMDGDVSYVALADHIHPLGPMPGICASVPIETPEGPRPVSQLRRGDKVITACGKAAPVLHAVRLTVPARAAFRPIRLRAPYYGLSQDIHLAPQERLILSGSDVEYLFGSESVLLPARHLVDQTSAFHADCGPLVTYHHLLLPRHQAVMAAGGPIESLYIGRFRRKTRELSESILSHCNAQSLPEHARPIWPVLRPVEAVTLARWRAA
ncbi:Hint domain-containing protein [Roseovarius sp. C7]|uniref:Hint domain-containing protein n=1 Tax=Roseovarius sp. C7 TaxID=3398643 RepID=UPI0039F68022